MSNNGPSSSLLTINRDQRPGSNLSGAHRRSHTQDRNGSAFEDRRDTGVSGMGALTPQNPNEEPAYTEETVSRPTPTYKHRGNTLPPIDPLQQLAKRKNFILNIDNQILSSRQNRFYIGDYYKKFTNKFVNSPDKKERLELPPTKPAIDVGEMRAFHPNGPAQPKTTRGQAPPLDLTKLHGASVQNQSLALDSLNEPTAVTYGEHPSTTRPNRQGLIGGGYSIDASINMPENSTSIVQNLNASLQRTARDEFLDTLRETERKKFRKEKTQALFDPEEMPDLDGDQASIDSRFKFKGALEGDQHHELKSDADTFIESDIYEKIDSERNLQMVDTVKNLRHSEDSEGDAAANSQSLGLTGYQTANFAAGTVTSGKLTIREADGFDNIKAKIKLRVIKNYQEDLKKKAQQALLEKKADEETAAAFNRVAAKQEASKDTLRSTAKPKRKKHAPIKRKRSFHEVQLKFEDGLKVIQHGKKAETDLTDARTIRLMRLTDRFPIPENLMNRPKHFLLQIDSLMHSAFFTDKNNDWGNYKQELSAPYNSLESEEDFNILGSESSTDDENKKPVVVVKKEGETKKKIDLTYIAANCWNMNQFKVYPHRAREGEIPVKLLYGQKMEIIEVTAKRIAEEQKVNKYGEDFLQEIFKHFCSEFKAAPIHAMNFLFEGDNNTTKLSFRNYHLDENTGKALACTIPFMTNIDEVEMISNGLSDHLITTIIMAVFMNPTVKKFVVSKNYCRTIFAKTFAALIKQMPEKLHTIFAIDCMPLSEVVEPFARVLPQCKVLQKLNISGNGISQNTCRILGNFLINSMTLCEVDFSHCRIGYQGTRYIVDALNRNVYIRQFNFAFNEMGSSKYEFSIKIASVLTRHPSILHMDITHTGLKREEVLFVGLALSMSKTVLSVHLTANELPYYDRVFLRAVIAARVGYQFKNEATKAQIKNNKERNQILYQASGEVHDEGLMHYIKMFNELDEKRDGLDFEINDIIEELDLEKQYRHLPEDMTADEIDKDSKLGQLIGKIKERQAELEKQKKMAETMMSTQQSQISKQLQTLANLKDLKLYDKNQEAEVKKFQKEEKKDPYQMEKELKVERQRIAAEKKVLKGKDDRTAGEMALMFMGINQIAHELLVENPMTGYMQEVIFSRIIGHDEIEQNGYWKDTTQCWVCERWNKVTITIDPKVETEIFNQRVTQIDSLRKVVEKCTQSKNAPIDLIRDGYDTAYEKQQKSILELPEEENQPESDSSEVTIDDKNLSEDLSELEAQDARAQDAAGTEADVDSSNEDEGNMTMSTVSKFIGAKLDKQTEKLHKKLLKQETEVEKKQRPNQSHVNTDNPLNPVRLQQDEIKKEIFPENFNNATDFEELNLGGEIGKKKNGSEGSSEMISDSEYGDEAHPLEGESPRKGGPRDRSPSVKDLTQKASGRVFKQNLDDVVSENFVTQQTTVVTATGAKRKRGEPIKIQRQVFFEGMVYQIEEEVYSDSDKSSVYTSEDDFYEDRHMQKKFAAENPLPTQAELDDLNATLSSLSKSATDKQGYDANGIPDWRQKMAQFGTEKDNQPLSKAQKEYKSKLTAKHYIPKNKSQGIEQMIKEKEQKELDELKQKLVRNRAKKVKKYRKEHNCELEEAEQAFPEIDDDDIRGEKDKEDKKKKKNQGVKSQKSVSFNMEAEIWRSKKVYIIASFNDWQPVELKTLRDLNLEKNIGDDEMPKSIWKLDNHNLMTADFVSPGAHYFYFVREGMQIFLSPKYDVVRFKNTSIFLNRVVVKMRLEDFNQIIALREGAAEEAVFMKDRSVFRDFKEDTNIILKKAFEEDMGFAKLLRYLKSDEVSYEGIKNVLWYNYLKLKNIHLFYIGKSTYPTISLNDYTSWAKGCGIIDDKVINLTTSDRTLIATNVNSHNYINSAERDLQRYEFLEIIVRLADKKFKEQKIVDNSADACQKLLDEHIYPNSQSVDGDLFRKYHCYNVKVNEILKKNEVPIRKVYDTFCHSKKKTITLEEAQGYVRKCNFNVSEIAIGYIFAESMMTIIDTIRDITKPNQMKFVEWYVFICRMVHEHYQGTPYAPEPLWNKLDHMMQKFLDPLHFSQEFSFDVDFNYKPRQRKKKVVRKGASQRSKSVKEDSDDDSDDDDESGSEGGSDDGRSKADKSAMEGAEEAQSPKPQEAEGGDNEAQSPELAPDQQDQEPQSPEQKPLGPGNKDLQAEIKVE